MGANTLILNGSPNYTWYVGDSVIEEVVALLDEKGVRDKKLFADGLLCMVSQNPKVIDKYNNMQSK